VDQRDEDVENLVSFFDLDIDDIRRFLVETFLIDIQKIHQVYHALISKKAEEVSGIDLGSLKSSDFQRLSWEIDDILSRVEDSMG